jgi:hypothetical protein
MKCHIDIFCGNNNTDSICKREIIILTYKNIKRSLLEDKKGKKCAS